ELREPFADQGERSFGGIALVPRRLAQPVSELGLVEGVAFRGPEMEPSQEGTGGLCHGGPEAVARKALVVAQEPRQDVVADDLTRRRLAPVDEVLWPAPLCGHGPDRP